MLFVPGSYFEWQELSEHIQRRSSAKSDSFSCPTIWFAWKKVYLENRWELLLVADSFCF